jgi:hypothetical protein
VSPAAQAWAEPLESQLRVRVFNVSGVLGRRYGDTAPVPNADAADAAAADAAAADAVAAGGSEYSLAVPAVVADAAGGSFSSSGGGPAQLLAATAGLSLVEQPHVRLRWSWLRQTLPVGVRLTSEPHFAPPVDMVLLLVNPAPSPGSGSGPGLLLLESRLPFRDERMDRQGLVGFVVLGIVLSVLVYQWKRSQRQRAEKRGKTEADDKKMEAVMKQHMASHGGQPPQPSQPLSHTSAH